MNFDERVQAVARFACSNASWTLDVRPSAGWRT
jgi:hypothetical protein